MNHKDLKHNISDAEDLYNQFIYDRQQDIDTKMEYNSDDLDNEISYCNESKNFENK